MPKFFLVISLWILPFVGFSQLFDSIQESLKHPPNFLLKLDVRNSFVTANYAKVKGFKIGFNYNKTFRYGVGYSWMQTDYFTIYQGDSSNLRLGYGLTFLEYSFYKSRHWHFELPIQLGIGRIAYKDLERNLQIADWVPIWEPAMTFEYLFMKYFGVGVGAGYRLVIKSKTPISEQFTSPIYIFKFKIYFEKLYEDFVKNEK